MDDIDVCQECANNKSTPSIPSIVRTYNWKDIENLNLLTFVSINEIPKRDRRIRTYCCELNLD